MAEVFKRDKQQASIAKTYAFIKANAENATMSMVTVWQSQLEAQYNKFQILQDAVIDRAGSSELDEQNKIDERVEFEVYKAKLLLEDIRTALKPNLAAEAADAPKAVDIGTQLLRQNSLVFQRFEVSCNRIINNISQIQGVQIGVERASLDQLYNALQDLSLQRAAQGTDPGELAVQEEASSAIYRQALGALLGAQPPPIDDADVIANNDLAAGADALRIPYLQITPFDGRFDKWEAFRESFEHGIHARRNLGAVQKLQYLKSILRGEAEELISNFGLTAANYETAWELLKKRYNNTRELVISHLQVITSLPKCSESAEDLRRVCNKISTSLLALKNLNRPTDQWNDWVVFHACEKLDVNTRRLWEHEQANNDELPTWDQLDTFLQGHIRALACGGKSQSKSSPAYSKPTKIQAHQTSYASSGPRKDNASQSKCSCCGESHLITWCDQFRRLSVNERRGLAAQKALCFICLYPGHHARDCKIRGRLCQLCGSQHNTMLHEPRPSNNDSSSTTPPLQVTHTQSLNVVNKRAKVLLATAVVNVRDAAGVNRQLRALLDQGAEASFVTEHAAQLLQLPRKVERVEMEGLGGTNAGRSSHSIIICVSDRFDGGFSINVAALIIPRINNRDEHVTVVNNQQETNWPHTADIVMADPDYMQPHKIDLLLGGDVYGKLLLSGLRNHPDLPTAQNTHLGWILSGRVGQHLDSPSTEYPIISHHISVDNQLAKFWEIEEISATRQHTPDEAMCEKLFDDTVNRGDDGRIHVRLPIKRTDVNFGESQRFAVQRQLQIERRFERNPEFAEQYKTFMAQYCDLGHMEEVVGAKVDMSLRNNMSSGKREYYIPHHAVIKEASSTTKLRVVFDASRRSTTGISLNAEMFIGPRLQDDLTDIMMRWRKFKVAFTADIEKMYRQFVVDTPDSDMQRIVWRPTSVEPMKVFRLSTVTYGTASAPYLAIKSLQTLATMESEQYPLGAQIVKQNFYVDDVLGGAHSTEDCTEAQRQLIALLSSGGLSLRKWASNDETILSNVIPAHRECQLPLKIYDGQGISTLGIQWNPSSDEMGFKIYEQCENTASTKRSFLSAASRLYDPLGWAAPCTIVVKIMFQTLWKMNLDWDDELPADFVTKWEMIRTSLQQLRQIQIKRWIGTTDNYEVELHGFCDASLDAFAAVIFARVTSHNQPTSVHILCAKTRVAPIKVLSLPRLELCGAALLTELMKNVKHAMQWPNVIVHCWTDSTIVLAWLRGDPSTYNVFVANRVGEIQRKIPAENWHHVRTDENPADCASRGITVSQLCNHRLWWTGPTWLLKSSNNWPDQPTELGTTEELRVRVKMVNVVGWELINQFSSWRRLVRVTAWCLRFASNCRVSNETRVVGVLEPAELIKSREFWVRSSQLVAFHDEIRCLRNNKPINKGSSLLSLNPSIFSDNLLRVGGRLANAHELTEWARTPAIVPRRSHLSTLLISDAHERTMHGGPALMLAYLRRAYWIVDGPNQVRQFVKRCTTCFRESAKPQHQLMAALPTARVVPSRPFLHCAMDYSGAMMVRTSKGRGHRATKAYVAVFVCLSTKAVHIELVGDLSTLGFVAAYERFISRRGCCSDLYSDNATNFVGAARTFLRCERDLYNKELQTILANKGTTWHFSPPLAPHFNGLAESAIRSVKHHIRRVVGESTLTFEELVTVLTKIEACLNSRPLYPMTNNPDDCDVLTPGHFLIGEPISAIPQRDVSDCKISMLTRWQLTHQMVQRFWKRWSLEYLHTLQQRRKWKTTRENIEVGDLVLILEDNMPPAKWARGRVLEVHPGADGIVRVVTIKARGSTFKRSIVKVARLPVETTET